MRTWFANRLVPVVAHSRDRASGVGPAVAKPEVGLRWGKPARASYSATSPKEEPGGGGFNTIQPPEHKHTKRVHNLSPVYGEYDVLEVHHAERTDETIEVALTTAAIFPLGVVTEKRIVAATFVGGAVVNVQTEDVKIARYLRLAFAPPRPKNSRFVRTGKWGEYPKEPEEIVYG